MTEYDLTTKQLASVLQATIHSASLAHWILVLEYAEDIKLLASHLQLLSATDAPKNRSL